MPTLICVTEQAWEVSPYRYIGKMKRTILVITLSLFILGCGGKNIHPEEDLNPQFEKAMQYFDKEKFGRAKDEFDYIIMTDPGSKLASRSQFYKGESLFHIEEYGDASAVFDRFVRFSNDLDKIETARYRICQCAMRSTNTYQRDQSQTHRALDQLQMFIEDFPQSRFTEEAEETMGELRNKLAKKDYEVGRMYLKLEEHEPALLYFQSVLNSYYDTPYADEARIGIIFTHVLNDNWQAAHNYFKGEKKRFRSDEKQHEAMQLIEETASGLNLPQYIQLYK